MIGGSVKKGGTATWNYETYRFGRVRRRHGSQVMMKMYGGDSERSKGTGRKEICLIVHLLPISARDVISSRIFLLLERISTNGKTLSPEGNPKSLVMHNHSPTCQ